MKRLGVFVFFDRDSIVDDYVLYMLDDMCKNLEDLVIISNSPLPKKEKAKFLVYTDKIIERENKGLDAGAWCEFFRENKDYFSYDEVVCFNDTFFGPLYPFKEMFDCMDKKDVDFWGLSLGHTHPDGYGVSEDGSAPDHIQTFLITFRNSLFKSDVFQEYWKNYNIDEMLTFVDVVSKHELFFAKYLEDRGFKWDCYIKDNDSVTNFRRNYVNFAHNSYDQIAECRAPFIKRKTIVADLDDQLYLSDLGDVKRSLDYIKNHTDYDINLIYKNVLRLYNIDCLRQNLGLYEIINEKEHSRSTEVDIIIKFDNEQLIGKFRDIFQIFDKKKHFIAFTKSKKIYESLKGLVDVKIYKDSWQDVFIKSLSTLKSEYVQYVNLSDNENSVTLVSEVVGVTALNNLFLSKNYYESVLDRIKDENTSVVYTPENLHFDYLYNNLFWNENMLKQMKKIFPNYRYFELDRSPVGNVASWLTKRKILDSIDFSNFDKMSDDEFSNVLSVALIYSGIDFVSIPKIIISEEMANIKLNTLSSVCKDTYRAIYRNNEYPLTYLECLGRLNQQREERRFIKVLKDTIKRKLHIRRFKFWKK